MFSKMYAHRYLEELLTSLELLYLYLPTFSNGLRCVTVGPDVLSKKSPNFFAKFAKKLTDTLTLLVTFVAPIWVKIKPSWLFYHLPHDGQ